MVIGTLLRRKNLLIAFGGYCVPVKGYSINDVLRKMSTIFHVDLFFLSPFSFGKIIGAFSFFYPFLVHFTDAFHFFFFLLPKEDSGNAAKR